MQDNPAAYLLLAKHVFVALVDLLTLQNCGLILF